MRINPESIHDPRVRTFYALYWPQHEIVAEFFARVPDEQYDFRMVDTPQRRSDSVRESLAHLLYVTLVYFRAARRRRSGSPKTALAARHRAESPVARAGAEGILARGLLAREALRREMQGFSSARRDLEEATCIAVRSSFRLHEAGVRAKWSSLRPPRDPRGPRPSLLFFHCGRLTQERTEGIITGETPRLCRRGGKETVMARIRWQERITVAQDLHHGDPCIKGTRIPVTMIVGSLADGMTATEILESYPELTDADIYAALAYAAEVLRQDLMIPLAA